MVKEFGGLDEFVLIVNPKPETGAGVLRGRRSHLYHLKIRDCLKRVIFVIAREVPASPAGGRPKLFYSKQVITY